MATEFGKLLRIIRINTNDTAKVMAEKLGISVPYLNAIENGRRDIPAGLEEKIYSNYELSDKDKSNLHDAIIKGKDMVKIDLTELSEKKRRVIMALSKDDIDNATLDQICEMVNSKRSSSK